jgi:hypothetical protein
MAENDRAPAGISAEKSNFSNNGITLETTEFDADPIAARVSMVSAASMQSIEAPIQKTQRNGTLKAALEAGQTGRVQPASRELLSWVNRSATADDRVTFRLSDAAWQDLLQFQIGLKSLPGESSNQAIDSLRRALFSVSSHLGSPCNISDSPHVYVVASDDANIYFRKVHGQIELVRVLPIDLSKAECP